jgi:hypothetical protein
MSVLGADGLLPEGVHDMSLEDVKARFGTFASSDHRPRLYDKLVELVRAAASVDFVRFLIVNGSFVTAKPDPGDIDLIVAIDPAVLVRSTLTARDYNLLSSKRLRHTFPFDVFVAPDGSGAYREYLDLFSKVKGVPGARKGVVKLVIR